MSLHGHSNLNFNLIVVKNSVFEVTVLYSAYVEPNLI